MPNLTLTALIMLVLDLSFLYLISDSLKTQIHDAQGSSLRINWVGAALCYAILIFALYFFILRKHRPVSEAFVLGFVIYGVYETTTISLLKNWRWSTVLVDTLWGGTLFALTTHLTYSFLQ
jgi:uncharacterized membrane protein